MDARHPLFSHVHFGQFEEGHRKVRRRSSSPFDDYAHHAHERGDGYHGYQTFPKREPPHWVETEYRTSEYSCEVNLPYMDSAEPNLDAEIEVTNDSDSKDARLNPADYVVCFFFFLFVPGQLIRTRVTRANALSVSGPRRLFRRFFSKTKRMASLIASTVFNVKRCWPVAVDGGGGGKGDEFDLGRFWGWTGRFFRALNVFYDRATSSLLNRH